MVSISVSLVSRRYWLAIPVAERERIEAAVPAGQTLVIKPGFRAKPGTTDVSLRDGGNSTVGVEHRGRDIAWMCWAVLPRVASTPTARAGPE